MESCPRRRKWPSSQLFRYCSGARQTDYSDGFSNSLDGSFKPSKYGLEDFYGDGLEYSMVNRYGLGIFFHRQLVRLSPKFLDTTPIGFNECSDSSSLSYICWWADGYYKEELIADLVSSKLPLPTSFLNNICTFPSLNPMVRAKPALVERGGLDWSQFRDALGRRKVEEVIHWFEKATEGGTCSRMLQVSTPHSPLAVPITALIGKHIDAPALGGLPSGAHEGSRCSYSRCVWSWIWETPAHD